MVQLTERASEELQRLLRDGLAGPRQGVRLRLDAAGRLAMAIDVPHLGDSVIRRGTAPLLIVDARLADRPAPRVLDFARHMDARTRGGFVLLVAPVAAAVRASTEPARVAEAGTRPAPSALVATPAVRGRA